MLIPYPYSPLSPPYLYQWSQMCTLRTHKQVFYSTEATLGQQPLYQTWPPPQSSYSMSIGPIPTITIGHTDFVTLFKAYPVLTFVRLFRGRRLWFAKFCHQPNQRKCSHERTIPGTRRWRRSPKLLWFDITLPLMLRPWNLDGEYERITNPTLKRTNSEEVQSPTEKERGQGVVWPGHTNYGEVS